MANEVQVSVRRSATIGGVTIGSAADEVVNAAITATYRQTIPAGSVDYEVDFPITVGRVLVSAVHSTQLVTLLTNANHLGSPAQTITVPADGTLIYNSARDPSGAKTFTTTVTTIYVQNAGSSDAILEIGIASSPS